MAGTLSAQSSLTGAAHGVLGGADSWQQQQQQLLLLISSSARVSGQKQQVQQHQPGAGGCGRAGRFGRSLTKLS